MTISVIAVTILELKEYLPVLGDTNLSLEDQARTALHLLQVTDQASSVTTNPLHCPNCDQPVPKNSSPYCSDSCKAQAAFIRQLRASLATGTILNPEKQTAFGERLWWLLGGGLPMRDSRIPESAKRQVIKRCNGLCEICGAPMVAIQNFGSGCNRPLHLRAVCSDCSKTKPFGDHDFATSPPAVELLKSISERINATNPIRPCDDPENWNWRSFIAARKEISNEAQQIAPPPQNPSRK